MQDLEIVLPMPAVEPLVILLVILVILVLPRLLVPTLFGLPVENALLSARLLLPYQVPQQEPVFPILPVVPRALLLARPAILRSLPLPLRLPVTPAPGLLAVRAKRLAPALPVSRTVCLEVVLIPFLYSTASPATQFVRPAIKARPLPSVTLDRGPEQEAVLSRSALVLRLCQMLPEGPALLRPLTVEPRALPRASRVTPVLSLLLVAHLVGQLREVAITRE